MKRIRKNVVFAKGSEKLDPSECKDRSKDWQKCLVGDLGNLFYAYNEKAEAYNLSQVSQRVLSFSLFSTDNYAEFLSTYIPGKSSIAIYMGCGEEDLNGQIPEIPKFKPFIQIYHSEMAKPVGYENCFSLDWTSLPPDTQSGEKIKISSGGNVQISSSAAGGLQITSDISNLFTSSWVKAPFNDLPGLFEAPIGDAYVARVRKYIFGSEVTDKVVTAMRNSRSPLVSVLLGKELTSLTFPFGFRPVLFIQDLLWDINSKRPSPISELPVQEFFEFANPCPPYCKDDGD